MKQIRCLLLSLFVFVALGQVLAQNAVRPERTPEQEATKQTEMLQRTLNLTPNQVESIQAINLKYALERQASNTRADAIERMKRKNADYQKVLTRTQYDQLQNRQMERARGASESTSWSMSAPNHEHTDSLRPVRPNFNSH